MPTLYREDGYRFFFFSNENEEPPHVHVEKAEGYAKFWLQHDVELAWSKGFRQKDLKRIAEMLGGLQEWILENGMSSSKTKLNPMATKVNVTPTFLKVTLADGRELAVPLGWFSTPEEGDAAAEEEMALDWRRGRHPLGRAG